MGDNADRTVTEMNQEIPFSIDGESYTTRERRQPAADILRLAGLDPNLFDLGEVRGRGSATRRYTDDDIVTIRRGARFVSIRERADVA